MTIARAPLTDHLLGTLADQLDKPVGDMTIPKGAGWMGGGPNAPGSRFVPYVVLISLSSSRSAGPLGDSQADWQMPYMLESFGVSRKQCEVMADKARGILAGLRRSVIDLSGTNYKVQFVHTDSLGAINRVAVTDPAFYGQQDGISIWLTKEHS